jgi:DNA repair exonuclease SbcCD ATPase subunit
MDEGPLQEAIMAAVNTRMPQKVDVVTQITDALLQEAVPSRGSAMTLGEVKRRIEELTAEFDQLLEQDASGNEADRRFAEISREMAELKRQRERIAAQLRNNQEAQERVHSIKTALDQEDHHLTQWDEEMIRQLVHTVKVISADHIRVYLNDGTEIDQMVGP